MRFKRKREAKCMEFVIESPFCGQKLFYCGSFFMQHGDEE